MPLDSLIAASSASAGGVVSTVSLYPLEMLRSRLSSGKDVSTVLREVGGTAGLYKGVQYKALQVALCKFIFFYVYDALQARYRNMYNAGFTPGANLLAGYLSDLAMLPVTLPVESLITKLQHAEEGDTIVSVVAKVRRTSGLTSLYAGAQWQLLVSLLAALQQTIFDQVKPTLLKHRTALTAREALSLGAFSRFVALIFIFPFIKIKTLIQSGKSKSLAEVLEVC